MRRGLTPPEARLWACLKGGKLGGFKFRRQHPIGPYILDFYCAAARLAVEVDGAIHEQDGQAAHDLRRTAWLAAQKIDVVLLSALSVRDGLDEILMFLAGEVRARSSERQRSGNSPSTTPFGRGPLPIACDGEDRPLFRRECAYMCAFPQHSI